VHAHLELADVRKRYGDAEVVRGVSFAVETGELICVVGESGSGKTTLVKMINRLVEPDGGVVRVDGVDIRQRDPIELRRSIGYVIQHAGLFPHWTIAANVATVPRLLGWAPAEIERRVDELLALVGLPPKLYRARYPAQLSGGQQQRVGIARALAAKPKLMLLDEPMGALDPITRAGLQDELRRLHRDLGLTLVMVTHDLIEALALADRVAVMWRGELRQLATPSELMRAPADDDVARLMAMAKHHADQLARVTTPGSSAPPDPPEPRDA
jgi:osmoprotectant transport system ATP-binding protein